MLIQKAYIRNVAPYLEGIGEGVELRMVAAVTDANRQKLPRIGFNDPPGNGDTILPLGGRGRKPLQRGRSLDGSSR